MSYKDSEVFDRYIEGLIKAGFEGDPSDYFRLNEENKLTGQEIQDLVMGNTRSGYLFGFPWSTTPIKNGKFEHTDFYGADKGKMWVEGDSVCRQYETRWDGIKHCEDIYKNPEGDDILLNEYFSITDYWLMPFSIME